MAMVTDSTRTTLTQQAAIAFMVCAGLVFCGCRSPWRSWRSDEPTLEQLLLHPEPWDAEARLRQESPAPRAGSAQNGDRAFGRANPYAAGGSALAGREAVAAADTESTEQSSQAEFEAAYAAAPPHLRGLLKRQWEATRAHRSAERDDGDADPRVADSRRRRSSDGPSPDRRMQKPAEAAPSDGQEAAGETPAVGRLTAKDGAKRPIYESDDSEDEGTVVYSLSDDDEEGSPQVATRGKSKPEELAPPPGKKAVQPVAHAEPIDTGAGDDVLVQPAARGGQRDRQTNALAAHATPPKSARTAQTAAEVTTASAEGEASGNSVAPTAVASAVAETKTATVSEELDWREHVRLALRELEKESENATDSPAEQLHRQATLRMLRLALGELEPALKPIDGLQTHEQEFFRHQFQALHDAIDPKGNPVLARRWTLALDNQRKAMAHLAAVSNLEIKNASFCTDVHSFGVVSKFPNPHFKPNQELLLYCELDNFAAEPVKDGYETQLQGSYEIVNASGQRVADMLLPEDADVCRNQRRDYFIAYRIYMPQKIEPGRYQLRLTIEDMKGRKFGQSSLDFQIVP